MPRPGYRVPATRGFVSPADEFIHWHRHPAIALSPRDWRELPAHPDELAAGA